MAFLAGFKTYIIGAAFIGWGIYQCANGQAADGANHIGAGLAIMTGRSALTNATK